MDNTMLSWSDSANHASGGIFYPNTTNFPALKMSHIKDISLTGTIAAGTVWPDLIGDVHLTLGGTVASDTNGVSATSWSNTGTLPAWGSAAFLVFLVTGKPSSAGNAWLIGGNPQGGGNAGIQVVRSANGVTAPAISADDTTLNYHDHAAVTGAPGLSAGECMLLYADIAGNSVKRRVASFAGAVGTSTSSPTGDLDGMTSAAITTQVLLPSIVAAVRTRQMSLYALSAALTDAELSILALWQAKYPNWICPLLYKRTAAA